MTTIDEIRDNFELLDEWDDRYRYVIELGRTLEPMPEAEHSAENKVQGCVSQVWLQKLVNRDGGAPILRYRGDSDAHIVRGLVAIVLSLYSGRTPQEILATDAGNPYRLRVRFDRALDDPRLVFLHAFPEGIRRIALPAQGETLRLPFAALPYPD